MHTPVVKIGNSKGIRIPMSVIRMCQIGEEVDLEVVGGKIIITPVSKPREGWEKAFKAMHENGDDALLIDDTLQDGDEEWEW